VQARFNAPITDRLAEVCRAELLKLQVEEARHHALHVPGALEVPWR
jgi:6,7-dimethyl-8-ribityllumazine synthase